MPYEIDSDEMEAAISLSLISPIPIAPKRSASDYVNAAFAAAASPRAQMSSGQWVSPPTDQTQRQLIGNAESDKILISDMQRFEMSREVYVLCLV